MKLIKSKSFSIIIGPLLLIAIVSMVMGSCKPSQKVAAKMGVQLWAENCQRCHNTPSPSTFSPEQWETIGMHMQTRALLTDTERKKIVEFLKQQ